MKEELKDKKKAVTRKKTTRKVNNSNQVEMVKKTVEFNLLEVIVIILITGIVVSIASGLIVYNNYDKLSIK